MTNRPWIAERTAEINLDADTISNLNVGDGVSVSVWTDIDAYTIVKKTPTTITLRMDDAVLINRDDLKLISWVETAEDAWAEVTRFYNLD